MEKLKMQTADMAERNVELLGQMFPNCLTETINADGKLVCAIDFDKLRQELACEVVEGAEERYQFTWPDKRAAIRLANAPTNKTLRPCREESLNFDNTENLYIEGDNLEVLKLLRENYLGKVKMIYIDPPYNTGNDFVYNDDFAQGKAEFEAQSGLFDEEGHRMADLMVQNTESNGRFHTDWLNMIYPRLKVAKDLLSDDGVIFISIDDRESDNLIKVCDEIFGASSFVGNISWQKTYSPRNDSKGIPAEKESIIIYGRKQGWMPKRLPRTEEMNKMYGNPDNDFAPWRNDNAFASDARTHQGMVYAIQHPFTGELIYPYNNGHWRYSQEEMLRHMNGWCEYELRELDDAKRRAEICGIEEGKVRIGVKGIVLKKSLIESKAQAELILQTGPWPKFYFTKNGQGGIGRKTYLTEVDGKMVTNLWPHTEVGHTDEAKKELKALFDGDIPFDTPKPVRLIQRIVQISTGIDDIIIDFFSGAATTAHSVMQLNAEDGCNRRFIMVQIPEKTDNKYGNLCEIGKERIRRAGRKILTEVLSGKGRADGTGYGVGIDNYEEYVKATGDRVLDVGFRVLKLDESNMADVYYTPADTPIQQTLNFDALVDNIREGRTAEDLLFQVLPECNLPLSSKIEIREIHGKKVFVVEDGYLMACFDSDINDAVITAIAKEKPYYFVMCDRSIASDSVADNFDQIFNAYSKETVRRIL